MLQKPVLSLPLAVVLCLLASAPIAAPGVPYHDLAGVEAILTGLAAERGDLVELLDIGTSAGGRPLRVVQVAGAGPLPASQRPAVFVGANMAGYHNAGSEAALHLLEVLTSPEPSDEVTRLLREHTFYVAPVLNPDAHDGMFAPVRWRRSGNASRLDRDRDGLLAEDGADDLDGDGRITLMRIPDPTGSMVPDPDEPRLLTRADPLKGQAGVYRVAAEGGDDDGDGAFNEDGPGGVAPDRNFPQAHPFPAPEAGPWPGFAAETRAVMDFLLAHRNVALAVVYGPANNLLDKPRGFGGGAAAGSDKVKVPGRWASRLGVEPDEEYSLDDLWELGKDLPMVQQYGVTKDRLAQMLGAGPATTPEADDLKLLEHLAESYKKHLEDAGLDSKRPAAQYQEGGLTPWLYFHYGVVALELDVWGVPKPAPEPAAASEELTPESLATMSTDALLALGEEKIAAFLASLGAPPSFTAARVMERLGSGELTPARMAEMAKRMGRGGAGGTRAGGATENRERQVLAWVDEHVPGAFAPWTPVTLPDGTKVEVGGLDPFAEIAPPAEQLAPAVAAHTRTVLDLAGQLARVELADVRVEALGAGVFRVEATAANRGFLPTHSGQAVRARAQLPVLLELHGGHGVELLSGARRASDERLEGSTGTVRASWVVRAERRATVTVEVRSANAGAERRMLTLHEGS